jgi:hypothetical protein
VSGPVGPSVPMGAAHGGGTRRARSVAARSSGSTPSPRRR